MTVLRAFRSEWLKLLRPSMMLGGVGTMAGFAVLALVLRLSRVGGTHIGPGTDLTVPMVAASNGFAPIIVYTAPFLGLVALAVCAVAIGTEYGNGTLRNLLVRQPARLRLLTGKLLALASFVTLAVVVSYGVGLMAACCWCPVTASVPPLVHRRGCPVAARHSGQSRARDLGVGLIGAVLAIVLRSAAAAISVGLGYLLVGETLSLPCGRVAISGCLVCSLLPSVWEGPREVAYARALVLIGLYVLVAIVIAAILFRQRDVTV